MGTIYIPEDDYYNAVGADSREINRIRDAAPKHPGTVYVYVLGKASESPFAVGKKVFVKSPNYDFSATIWYIYQAASGYNLYLKTSYTVDDFSGVVSTSPIVEVPSGDILGGEAVGAPVDGGAGTGTPSVVAAKAAGAVGGSKNLIYIGLAAIVALFVWKKYGGKKGKKGKKS